MDLKIILEAKKKELSDKLDSLNDKSISMNITQLQELKQSLKDDYHKTLSMVSNYQSNNKEIPSIFEDYSLLMTNVEDKINYEMDRQISRG